MGRDDNGNVLLVGYWALIALLVGASIFFTVSVQDRRRDWQTAAEVDVPSGAKVTVVDIINGDEVAVRSEGGVFVIRLLGIKTFDAKSHDTSVAGIGTASIEAMRALTEGRSLTLQYDDYRKDRHKHLLAFLEADGEDLGGQLVRAGQALAFIRYPCAREDKYLASQAAARSQGLGLWGQPKAATRAIALEATWRAQRDDD